MQHPSSPDSTLDLCAIGAERGYTPDNLPALRQYLRTRESGNLEAAARIGQNLLVFFETEPAGETG